MEIFCEMKQTVGMSLVESQLETLGWKKNKSSESWQTVRTILFLRLKGLILNGKLRRFTKKHGLTQRIKYRWERKTRVEGEIYGKTYVVIESMNRDLLESNIGLYMKLQE